MFLCKTVQLVSTVKLSRGDENEKSIVVAKFCAQIPKFSLPRQQGRSLIDIIFLLEEIPSCYRMRWQNCDELGVGEGEFQPSTTTNFG